MSKKKLKLKVKENGPNLKAQMLIDILENQLAQIGKVNRHTVNRMDPTEVVTMKGYVLGTTVINEAGQDDALEVSIVSSWGIAITIRSMADRKNKWEAYFDPQERQWCPGSNRIVGPMMEHMIENILRAGVWRTEKEAKSYVLELEAELAERAEPEKMGARA